MADCVGDFSPWASSATEAAIRHKGILRDEDDARTSNTCIAQRKRAITHSTMKNNRRNIGLIECCNNSHQGRHVPANKRALAIRTSVTVDTLLVVTYGILMKLAA